MTNLDYVKETQEALGVSNDRMANILGISNKKYLRYLMGNIYVPLTLRNFCLVLNGVSPARLETIEKLIDAMEYGT